MELRTDLKQSIRSASHWCFLCSILFRKIFKDKVQVEIRGTTESFKVLGGVPPLLHTHSIPQNQGKAKVLQCLTNDSTSGQYTMTLVVEIALVRAYHIMTLNTLSEGEREEKNRIMSNYNALIVSPWDNINILLYVVKDCSFVSMNLHTVPNALKKSQETFFLVLFWNLLKVR